MEGVLSLLEGAGLGLRSYYEWRTRSGCYFSLFQRKAGWARLSERHPDAFAKALALKQKVEHEATQSQGRFYTSSQGESLSQLVARRTPS
ncbi:hypothetical protein [Luteitalea sp.]|uniref:hypothetical protein n=1 Tax=Luteitalea sp. TaxID=2004800 RepID=UPI0025C4D32B|nr:hypothetical protein [Luteitalea sp.]